MLFIAFIIIGGTTVAQDYTFHKPDNNFTIRDVEYQNGQIYLLGVESIGYYSIQIFNTDNNTFETLFSSKEMNGKGLTDIKDMAVFENDLYVINDNKLINISDNYKEYSLEDEYDYKPKSDKYRQLHNLAVRGNSLLIGSTSADVISRDTIEGTPMPYIEPFNELLKYESEKIERIIDQREIKKTFEFNFSPVLDNQNNLWFRENQGKPLKGGLIKVSPNNEVEVFDLKSHSDENYRLMPTSIDIIDNSIYISCDPRKESNYLEGLSIYNMDEDKWTYTIDYLENNDIYTGINWEIPTKIKKLSNGNLAIIGYEFTIQHENDYLYYELSKIQKEKHGELANYRNIDLIETDSKYIIIRQNGVLVFDKSTISSVESQFERKYDYHTTNNIIEFNSGINNYKIFNLLGEINGLGENEKSINLNNLITGPYFILLNDEYIIKFVKE